MISLALSRFALVENQVGISKSPPKRAGSPQDTLPPKRAKTEQSTAPQQKSKQATTPSKSDATPVTKSKATPSKDQQHTPPKIEKAATTSVKLTAISRPTATPPGRNVSLSGKTMVSDQKPNDSTEAGTVKPVTFRRPIYKKK
jgi:hypothetical protein